MNGVHDMGGMHGFGPIQREANEPVFHHAWEGRAYAIASAPLVPVPFAYRSRVVREPRAVLREFGLELSESTEIRVWDSNSEVRYMVLPARPVGTEHLSEAELIPLVTRDAMIGVAGVEAPQAHPGGE